MKRTAVTGSSGVPSRRDPVSRVRGVPGGPRSSQIRPTLFGISFGITGLAQAWGSATRLYGVPSAPSNVLLLIASAVWCATAVLYIDSVRRGGGLRAELSDPVFAPFIALMAIVPMLLGAALAGHARTWGVVVAVVSMAFTVGLGGLLFGQWIITGIAPTQWHPGYFLPTAAGGYLSALTASTLGYDDLAMAMFGYGTISWLALGFLPWERVLTGPRLPGPLIPSMAILVAPPVVAGLAWFAMNGGRVDGVALGLAGYSGLMVLVQIRLVPVFRSAPFGPGWWAFSFSYSAVGLDAIGWLAATRTPHGEAWTYLILVVLSAGVLVLVGRTLAAVRGGRFLPALPSTPPLGRDA